MQIQGMFPSFHIKKAWKLQYKIVMNWQLWIQGEVHMQYKKDN
jgi:hypothetical protein